MSVIQIPGKYDIIPIHTSDVFNFQYCRRKWDWTSPARNNLRHRVEMHGINFPLWFGSGIHYALEMYYNPVLKRDPVEAFETWFELQWKGGIVTEDWLDRTYDINPRMERDKFVLGEAPLYSIRGLEDLHPSPDHEEFEEHRKLGIGMMEFYRDWAPKNDRFEVVAAEASFSVPLINPTTGEILRFVDTREQSYNYGKELEVHARGKRDTIILDKENSQYGLIDYKTASKIDEDYFSKLENDPQCGNYMWASQTEARMFGLPYVVISFIDYQAMWKKFPSPPNALKDGISPSLNRTEESPTADMFSTYIVEHGLTDWYENNQKAKDYYEYLVAEGDARFINRHRVYRNATELGNIGKELSMIAMDMLDPNIRIYKRPSGDRMCTRCQFRAPCLAKDDGSDWGDMLENGYERNKDR